jgi:hypothetical protein
MPGAIAPATVLWRFSVPNWTDLPKSLSHRPASIVGAADAIV